MFVHIVRILCDPTVYVLFTDKRRCSSKKKISTTIENGRRVPKKSQFTYDDYANKTSCLNRSPTVLQRV